MDITRREFIRTAALGSVALAGANPFASSVPEIYRNDPLLVLSKDLVTEWGAALLQLQVTATDDPRYGGILCPVTKSVHGRMGEAIYSFAYLAQERGEGRYVDAALRMYHWMKSHVSQPDGSWLNEPVKGSWKGTTVFTAIALAETLKHHGNSFEPTFKLELESRLKLAGDWISNVFSMEYGNINYPITASYCLSLLGSILDVNTFREKGKEFARNALKFITPENSLIYGEGTPLYETTRKGCYPIDLGYNVEESLPALVLYGLLNRDEEVLGPVTKALKGHLEFMLPDGGWDNSWGTRNYKWTWWGSRTSDGCQPAYALLANRDPVFYEAALRNTQLLQRCTHAGLLTGGPDYVSHGVATDVHHTFCHIKALTTILDKGLPPAIKTSHRLSLPREVAYGIRYIPDIHTWLVSKSEFKATVTGYDREYKQYTGGHPTGGALTLLWHNKGGAILCGSMTEYQLYEADNMQQVTDQFSMSLTPRIELRTGGNTYTNIAFLDAAITAVKEAGQVVILSRSSLVDKDQQHPPKGEMPCETIYTFEKNSVKLQFRVNNGLESDGVKVILPILSPSGERTELSGPNTITIRKPKAIITVTCSSPIEIPVAAGQRIFNHVPGFEAIPLVVKSAGCDFRISVK